MPSPAAAREPSVQKLPTRTERIHFDRLSREVFVDIHRNRHRLRL
jgi:hypothetical protein